MYGDCIQRTELLDEYRHPLNKHKYTDRLYTLYCTEALALNNSYLKPRLGSISRRRYNNQTGMSKQRTSYLNNESEQIYHHEILLFEMLLFVWHMNYISPDVCASIISAPEGVLVNRQWSERRFK